MKKLAVPIILFGFVSFLFGWGQDVRLKTPSSGILSTSLIGGAVTPPSSTSSGFSVSAFGDGVAIGTLTFSGWTELSGMVRTQRSENSGYMWVIDDGLVNPAQMRAVQLSTAGHGGAWTLTSSVGADVEDISSVQVGTQPYIYVVDSGDNSNNRTSFNVFRVREPAITGNAGSLAANTDYNTVVCTFPAANLPSQKDVECAFADPDNGDLYFITKRISPILVYKLPFSDVYVSTQQLTYSGTTYAMTFSTQASGANNGYVTGCDMSPNGLEIAVNNYNDMYVFKRVNKSSDIITMLQATPTRIAGYVGANRPASHPNNEPQGEAVMFTSDGRDLYTASEFVVPYGTNTAEYPLFKYSRLSSSPTEISFQDGLGTSTNTQDTYLYSLLASSVAIRGGESSFVVDWNASAPTDERQGLLKFDLSALPSTATIVGVDLFLNITTEGTNFRVYQMYDTWVETDTFASRGAFPLRDGVQASLTPLARHSGYDTLTGQVQINLPTTVVQEWVNGTRVNQGFLIYSDDIPGGDGLQFASRDAASQPTRPKLVVRYN